MKGAPLPCVDFHTFMVFFNILNPSSPMLRPAQYHSTLTMCYISDYMIDHSEAHRPCIAIAQ